MFGATEVKKTYCREIVLCLSLIVLKYYLEIGFVVTKRVSITCDLTLGYF